MKYYEKEKIKAVPVQDAVGKVLLHDITEIVPDLFKGPSFRKGHIITKTDVEKLLDLGKQHIYVAGLKGEIHENDAALRIARAAMGKEIEISDPKEGKVGFIAKSPGLLKINLPALEKLNSIEDVIFATLHTNQMVTLSQELAGTRVIPLSIDENKILEAEKICKQYFPIIEVKPLAKLDVGIVITGSEVFSGRIRDGFGPVVTKKFSALGSRVIKKIIVSDELTMTIAAIAKLLEAGAQMIAVTGGMSVDPDDLTPAAIRAAGGKIIFYGAPVLPGAMFMLAYIENIPILGLPGCVMYHRASIFDLILPRLLAGEKLKKTDMVQMGHGGFCASCKECRFPSCNFGK
ncbi:MAG: molybdopterin-binding protein [Desulfobacteraceae bacterium]|nr:molybdopterin-binding protein [Desulfobacteraceae bacterium]